MVDAATIFAWFVLALLFGLAVWAIVALGSLPKKIAVKRNHPQVEAINAASWIGLATGGIVWVFAFIWAFVKSGPSEQASSVDSRHSDEVSQLRNRVAELESQLEAAKK